MALRHVDSATQRARSSGQVMRNRAGATSAVQSHCAIASYWMHGAWLQRPIAHGKRSKSPHTLPAPPRRCPRRRFPSNQSAQRPTHSVTNLGAPVTDSTRADRHTNNCNHSKCSYILNCGKSILPTGRAPASSNPKCQRRCHRLTCNREPRVSMRAKCDTSVTNNSVRLHICYVVPLPCRAVPVPLPRRTLAGVGVPPWRMPAIPR